jgi:hypothetical protein
MSEQEWQRVGVQSIVAEKGKVMSLNVTINVPRVLRAMREKGWGRAATCAHCGVNSKTLTNILAGQVPKRIDCLSRLCAGLGITEEEALNAATHRPARLYVVSHRRSGGKEVA